MPATPAEIEAALLQLRLAKAALFVASSAREAAIRRGGKLEQYLPPLNAARDAARASVNAAKANVKAVLELP